MNQLNPFEPGRNCWRVERADRAAFLVDGESYFRAFRNAMTHARESVYILAWDIHSQVRLVREDPQDGWPVTLAEMLSEAVRRTRGLRVYVLAWDFAMIYAMEREWLPTLRFRWKGHRRVQVHLDSEHPLGASHHQKVVVIDDRVAFCGGMDLSIWRWDSSEHGVDDPRRVDPSGNPYPPFHDVQMVVEGAAAKALGDLARARWKRATGRRLRGPRRKRVSDPWPDGVEADVSGLDIALARTEPAFRGEPLVTEVERLHLDAIAAAQRFLYFENQYFSSRRLADALARRLAEPDGPEVVLVLPLRTGGWLEQHTMDVLRAGLIERLRQADAHDRFRVYYPVVGDTPEQPVYVHAKLQIVDDRFCRVGTANLSNRSMRLDTECDLALAGAAGSEIAAAIAGLRIRLLAEHLRMDPGSAVTAFEAPRSLIAAIEDNRRSTGGTLRPLTTDAFSEWSRQWSDAEWLDPEEPIDPECFVGEMLPGAERTSFRRRLLLTGSLLVLFLVLAVVWRWGPLGDGLGDERLRGLLESVQDDPLAPVLAVGVTVVASSVGVPITPVLVVMALVFGPWAGFLYAFCGAQVGALVTFGLGRVMGKDLARRLAGRRWSHVRRLVERRGVWVVMLIRMLPIAPFGVVNVVAGVSSISWRDFILGTAVGMIPGMLLVVLVADRLRAVLEQPTGVHVLMLVGAMILVVAGIGLLARWIGRSVRSA